MRHRSPLRRALTALFGLWFTLLVTEPRAVHACPMHDSVPAAPVMPSADESGHAAHHDVAGGSAESMQHAEHTTPSPTDHAGHQCLCLGCCSTTPPVAPLAPASLAWLAQILEIAPRLIRHGTVVAGPERVAHALPFANGPPTA
jgi:hypothetical protein